ncbi:hypothetical protein DFJ43DRAFT_570437 [Lentinula guzmanii]|uniref:Transcription factor domain-containing protein n=1 Tax=Lentinula guzmanii TaxID=2804957 RepID=A0AA38MSC1_9AGAR|nr:hypothetical protein DFJ43DRAFT_570437 [Lentinula guzmanii]
MSEKALALNFKRGRSRGQLLPRGNACINCRCVLFSQFTWMRCLLTQYSHYRHSKIRCDGVKPICGHCLATSKEADCKYTDPPSGSALLQRDIEELLVRIEVLKKLNKSRKIISTRNSSASLSLSPNSEHSSARTSLLAVCRMTQAAFVDNHIHSAFSFDADYTSSEPPFPERANLYVKVSRQEHFSLRLPLTMKLYRIDSFIGRCATLAFFLDPDTFRKTALLPLPLGDPQRPSPALLACVYLWGLRIFSPALKLAKEKEPAFLRRARQCIALEVGTQNPTHITHILQAKILLIIYLVNTGQFLEAEFHGNRAISLVLSYGLHKIIPTSSGVYGDPERRLPPCTGPAEQAERINAFWTVFYIQRLLAVMVGSLGNSFGSLDSYLEIRTPFPTKTMDYDSKDIALTLHDFLNDTAPQRPETSALSIYSKSALLYHRAVHLHRQLSSGNEDRVELIKTCLRFEQTVLNFYTALPKISYIKTLEASSSYPPFISSEKLSLMYATVSCACVNIQSILASLGVHGGRKRLIVAAEDLFSSLESSYPGSHPLAGTLSRLTCEALIEELMRLKAENVFGDVLDLACKVEEETQLEQAITDGMGTMSILVTCCPLVGYDLKKVRNLYLQVEKSTQ